ncbi:MAG: PDDEXK nuclease domain-containing protein [Ignavibacterium sp.]|nr:PDDEXK nuclease domain-containing protein [Ignavibacterium sp.]
MAKKKTETIKKAQNDYTFLVEEISSLLESARKVSARAVNILLTATYWAVGFKIINYEQNGNDRAEYGANLLIRLSNDLTSRFGKGFSVDNLESMRLFYSAYSNISISETASRKSVLPISEKSSRKLNLDLLSESFPLSWSHYVALVRRATNEQARSFYEKEALRSGWTVKQLSRQITSQFYERSLLSKNKSAMLKKAEKPLPEDLVTPEEEIKDPVILEFLGLKDEYSENDLEEALILHLENFLLELGGDFAFIGHQKRLRIGSEWYRIDLLFFHRKLRCLVVIDLKVGKFSHADAGQMHLYFNYAKEHWTNKDENPPVGIILCAEKDSAVAKYALEGLPNKVLASEYKLALPDEKVLQNELKRTQKLLWGRRKQNA